MRRPDVRHLAVEFNSGHPVRFSFSPEQEEFRTVVRRFLTDRSPTKEVRRLMETQAGWEAEGWKALNTELGLCAVRIPEALGGHGFGFGEQCVVLEEMGRALLCAPYFATAVLGAGAWGTALGIHLARSNRAAVTLWARDPAQAQAMQHARCNERYLPGHQLPDALRVTARLADVTDCGLLIAAPPVAALPGLAGVLRAQGIAGPLFWLSKGFLAEPSLPGGAGLPHRVLASRWPAAVGAISGPSFAEEVVRGLPTALAVAATDMAQATDVAALLHGETLRAYVSRDLPGIEVGGAVKNVLAIAAGVSDGLGFGNNARAALVTRGLAETGRLSHALGGSRETLMGLAGLGDLVLTCTGDLSRNRRVGIELAKGRGLAAILADLGHVAEGVSAAAMVRNLARWHGLDMPICDAVHRVLHGELSPRDAVLALLRREPRPEGA